MSYKIEKKREYQREWKNKRAAKFKKTLGPCVFCGSLDNIEIHHIDPEKKESHKIWSWAEDRILAELKQCIPMCHDCHTTFHSLLKRKPLKHGTLHGYQTYRCRCDDCRKARSDYYQNHEKKKAVV